VSHFIVAEMLRYYTARMKGVRPWQKRWQAETGDMQLRRLYRLCPCGHPLIVAAYSPVFIAKLEAIE